LGVVADSKGRDMTVLEGAPQRARAGLPPSRGPELVVSPSGITFHDRSADTVEVRVVVSNPRPYRSRPTFMRLESAPLGAFVPGRPLMTLPVPPLEPGESRTFAVLAARPHPTPLGRFDRVPPRRILTALGTPDEPPARAGSQLARALRRLFDPRTSPQGSKDLDNNMPLLAPDLFDLFDPGKIHWAGNLNVFIGDQAVERHLAGALRIHPGRMNLAEFVVGEPGHRDDYAFKIVGLPTEWEATLFDATNADTLVVNPSGSPLHEQHWVRADSGNMLMVMGVRPPFACDQGNVQVHVTRRSSRKTVVVEFDLDPNAQGPGCYVA